jgi:phenylalanyl-tRNA synthetase beta chain
MKYSYEGIKKYLQGNYSIGDLKNFLERLGLNPVINSFKNFELEIPSNRPDLMSAAGIAKSLLPFGDFQFCFPEFQISHSTEEKFPVEIYSLQDCYFYAGRVIKNTKVSSSPDWLKQQVESAGFRSINNIVDITNFVFWELGQPLHAFNKSILDSGIIVRKAMDNEQIITLDGVKRILNREILVIADKSRTVAIAGIMGGINTEVNEKTTDIFIESAFFNPFLIRKGSKFLGLRTEASSKFEKGIDPQMIIIALDRCCRLIEEIAGGKTGPLVLKGDYKKEKESISFSITKLKNYLGYNIPVNFIKEVFNKLGFELSDDNSDVINVFVKSDRQDIVYDVDLIEEIAKYYGYDKIPEEIPEVVIKPTEDDSAYLFLDKIKEIFTHLGFTEAINLGLISREEINNFEMEELKFLEILNPVSVNFSYLRPSMIIELLKNFQYNSAYKNENIALFETGNKYFLLDNIPAERMTLSFGVMDRDDLFAFKGKIEYFLKTYFFPEPDYGTYLEKDEQNTGIYYNIIVDNTFNLLAENPGKINLGFIFEPLSVLLEKYDLQSKKIFLAQMDLELLKSKGFLKNFFDHNKIPSIPSIRRDLSLVVKAGPKSDWGYIVQFLYDLESKPLNIKDKIKVFDIYYFSDKEKKELWEKFGFEENTDIIGVGISIYFSNEEGNLTKDDIDKNVHEIVEAFKKINIRLRYEQI